MFLGDIAIFSPLTFSLFCDTCLSQEVRNMYDTLRELHRKFWKELPVPEVERQYDEAFRGLMRRLEKPERKLVLRLLDTRGLLAENAAFDSFACGFRLALELTTESQLYQKERPEEALTVLCTTEEDEDEN